MRGLALSAGAAFAFAASVLTTAVSPSAQSSPEPQATFKATTRIVNVNVVVTDSHGNPITGLLKDDFELFDHGKPQNIRFFAAINNVAPAPGTPLPPDTYTNQQQIEGAPPSVTALLIDFQHSDWPAQVYSLNHVRAFLRKLRPDDRIAIYLLTDDKFSMLHDFTQDSSDLIAAIQRYDARHTGPKDHGAMPDSGAVSEFDRFLADGDVKFRFCEWPAIYRSQLNVVRGAYRCAPPSVRLDAVLPDIARHLASAPGRKSLIWLYGGTFFVRGASTFLPEEPVLQEELIRRVIGRYDSWPSPRNHGMKAVLLGANPSLDSREREDRALRDIRAGLYSGDLVPLLVRLFNDNSIAVYPIGAQGLQTIGAGGAEDLGFKNTDQYGPIGPPAPQSDISHIENQQPMISLAERTGGRAFYNRNDLERGIEHALDDGRYSYELAYYPDHNDWSGEWRKIQIKLRDRNRYGDRPSGLAQEVKNLLVGSYGVQVLARGGYFALPEPQVKLPPQHNRKEMLLATANSPSDAAALPLLVRVVPLPGKDELQIQLFLNLDAHNLLTTEDGNSWKGNFELLFFQLGRRRPAVPHASDCCALRTRSEVDARDEVPVKSYVLDLSPAEYQKAIATGMATTRKLKLQPGATTLVIVLHDKISDAVGSVRIPLTQYIAELQQPTH